MWLIYMYVLCLYLYFFETPFFHKKVSRSKIPFSPFFQDWKGKVIPYETSDFDGLEMRIRGDGRTYTVNVQPDSVRTDDLHQTFIYTRGGPYWETIRVRNTPKRL